MTSRTLHNRLAIWSLAALSLVGCGNDIDKVRAIKSPDGAVVLSVRKSDLGSCCSSRVRVSASVFGRKAQQVADIVGSSEIRYEWSGPDTLAIISCNASEATFRSGFQNENYTRRFIISIENERPQEDGNRVLCSSARFKRMHQL